MLTVKHRSMFEALNEHLAKPQSTCIFICRTKMYILFKSCHLLVIRILTFLNSYPTKIKKIMKKCHCTINQHWTSIPSHPRKKMLSGFLTFIGVCHGRIVSLLVVMCCISFALHVHLVIGISHYITFMDEIKLSLMLLILLNI